MAMPSGEWAPSRQGATHPDLAGRPIQRTDSRVSDALRFTWDEGGRLLSSTDWDGGVTQYRWDDAGRLLAVSTPERTQIERHYDVAGRMIAQYWSSGARTNASYTASGRLQQVQHRSATGVLQWSRDYQYDPVGNRTRATLQGGGVEAHTYDALQRLTRTVYSDGSEQRFDYDAVGNRTHSFDRGVDRWYFHDAANRTTRITSDAAGLVNVTTFAYDANGNRTNATTGSSFQNYGWDAADRLVSVTNQAGQTWTFAYDALGQRVAQTAPEKNRRYTWAGGNRIGEYNGSALVGRFTHGPGLDDLIQIARGSSVAHVHVDGLGTPLGLTSPSGSQLASYTYDSFGSLRTQTASFENDLRFTGREQDSTGLLYYRARFYDPALGRFLNQDPIGFDGGINFYAYANSNPTTLTDPTGKVAPLVLGVVGGVAGGVGVLYSNPDASWQEVGAGIAVGAVAGVTGGFFLPQLAAWGIGAAATVTGAQVSAPAVAAGSAVIGAGLAGGFADAAVQLGTIAASPGMGLNDFDWTRTGVASGASLIASPIAAIPAYSTAVASGLYGANSLAAQAVGATYLPELVARAGVELLAGQALGNAANWFTTPTSVGAGMTSQPSVTQCIKGRC